VDVDLNEVLVANLKAKWYIVKRADCIYHQTAQHGQGPESGRAKAQDARDA
jgi:hypothetical protein